MDCLHRLLLRGVMTAEDEHRGEVIGRLFALLTAKFEDGAELAVRGQDPGATARENLSADIGSLGREIAVIADGLLMILNDEDT